MLRAHDQGSCAAAHGPGLGVYKEWCVVVGVSKTLDSLLSPSLLFYCVNSILFILSRGLWLCGISPNNSTQKEEKSFHSWNDPSLVLAKYSVDRLQGSSLTRPIFRSPILSLICHRSTNPHLPLDLQDPTMLPLEPMVPKITPDPKIALDPRIPPALIFRARSTKLDSPALFLSIHSKAQPVVTPIGEIIKTNLPVQREIKELLEKHREVILAAQQKAEEHRLALEKEKADLDREGQELLDALEDVRRWEANRLSKARGKFSVELGTGKKIPNPQISVSYTDMAKAGLPASQAGKTIRPLNPRLTYCPTSADIQKWSGKLGGEAKEWEEKAISVSSIPTPNLASRIGKSRDEPWDAAKEWQKVGKVKIVPARKQEKRCNPATINKSVSDSVLDVMNSTTQNKYLHLVRDVIKDELKDKAQIEKLIDEIQDTVKNLNIEAANEKAAKRTNKKLRQKQRCLEALNRPPQTHKQDVLDEDVFSSDNSHTELDDDKYSTLMSAKDDSELEYGEIMSVKLDTMTKPFVHSHNMPVWKEHGYCYLAAIKTRALPCYRWRPFIKIIELASYSKLIRKNVNFDLIKTEIRNNHHLRINPFSPIGWMEIDNIARSGNIHLSLGGDEDVGKIPILTGLNWNEWSVAMTAFLRYKGLWQYVSGTKAGPSSLDESEKVALRADDTPKLVRDRLLAKKETWDDFVVNDDKALGLITLKLTQSLRHYVKNTAQKTWTGLQDAFGKPGAAGIFVDFSAAIHWKVNINRVTESVNDLLTITQRLDTNGFKFPDNMVAMLVLASLPTGWDSVSSSILITTKASDLKLADILPKIEEEQQRRRTSTHTRGAVNTARINKGPIKPQWQQSSGTAGPSNRTNHQKPYGPSKTFKGKSRDNNQQTTPAGPSRQFSSNQERNRFNRENKKKKRAYLLQQSEQNNSAGPSKGKAKAPTFATVALIDRLGSQPLIDRVEPAILPDNLKMLQEQGFCIADEVEWPVKTGGNAGNHFIPKSDEMDVDKDDASDTVSLGEFEDAESWYQYVYLTNLKSQTDHKSVRTMLMGKKDSDNTKLLELKGNNSSHECTAVDSDNVIAEIACYNSKIKTCYCNNCLKMALKGKLWMIDSGASVHVTPDLNDFAEYQSFDKPKPIYTADKQSQVVLLGEGTVFLEIENSNVHKHFIKLEKVCYMPEASHRLISSGQLKLQGWNEQSDKHSTIFSLKSGQEILKAYPRHANEPIHWVLTQTVRPDKSNMDYNAYVVNYDTWHKRLGHPSKNVLKHTLEHTKGFDEKVVFPSTNPICPGCTQGKMHNKSFPISNKRASKPLELIHADLLELPIESYHRKKWCLMLLDDYSSFAHMALLRSKSETLTAVQSYIKLMENQHDIKVKYFRSDRGGEFKSHEFDKYLANKGIFREQSAPHIHQQNGRAERLNDTILEKAESMRLDSSCPKSWWEFAFETAIHVYNHTPLRRTNWKTPYENLTNKKPDIHYLRIFGCLAWVLIPKEIRKDKLAPRSEPMTFIGYEQGSKAYRFMRKDNTIFIGVQSLFDESVFPRKSENYNKDRIFESPPGIDQWDQDGQESDSDSQNNDLDDSNDDDPKPKKKSSRNHDSTHDDEQTSSHDKDDENQKLDKEVEEQEQPDAPPSNSDVRGSSENRSIENPSERPGTQHQIQPPDIRKTHKDKKASSCAKSKNV